MKKLLSLFGIGLLTITGATSTVACQNKITDNSNDKDNKAEEKNNDLIILNEIIKKAKNSFQAELFKEIVLGNTPDLLKSYKWVNNKKKNLTLEFSNPEHQSIINYFVAMFQLVYDKVNQEISNDYPNYYTNSVPLTFNKADTIITLNFINLKQINQKLGLKINGIEQIKAVKINFNLKYNIKFKDLTTLEEFNASFNMTNNIKLFNKLHDGSLLYFQNNLIQWLDAIKMVKLNEGTFKPLYDDFYISFSNDSTLLALKYKKLLQDFIKNNENLNKIDISYNENNDFIWMEESRFNNPEDFGKYYENVLPKNKAEESRLYNWGADKIEQTNSETFVKYYKKKIAPKLDTTKNQTINLATFRFLLNYINIYGMTLKGYAKDAKNIIFKTTVTLSEDAINQKLTNFGNLIIAFLKFYKITYQNNRFDFQVNYNNFIQISKVLNNEHISKNLLKIFRTSDVAKNLPDLNLFNFNQSFGDLTTRFDFDKSDHLIHKSGMFDGTFAFGTSSSSFYYIPFFKSWNYKGDEYGIQRNLNIK